MKKIILIVLLCSIEVQVIAQNIYHAFYYSVNMYNTNTEKYDQFSNEPCDILIFQLVDKIKIKNQEKTILYIKYAAKKDKVGKYDLQQYICYDQKRNDCTAAFMTSPGDNFFIVTYDKETMVSYNIKIDN